VANDTKDVDPKAHTEVLDDQGAPVTPFDATLTDAGGARRVSGRPDYVGKTLAHFHIEKLLGKGGMGEVYLANDAALDRRVAIKVLPREFAEEKRLRKRFYREARAQARLNHPNVCHIYFIGEQDEQIFFAMEYIEGESLQQRLERDGPMSHAEALEFCRMAALGLCEAQANGFTHRDIKPSNLMVDKHGTVKVVDFGLVKESAEQIEAGAQAVSQSVDKTALVGTPLYMAPEQARGEPIGVRSDIYSLGATLHHLVSGAPPFSGDTPMAILSLQLTEERPRLAPRSRARRGPAPLDALCDRMMAKNPEDRFDDYDSLVDEMDRISPARTRPAGFWVRCFAAMLDFIAIGVVTQPVTALTDFEGLASFMIFGAAYAIVCHALWGRTLGKAALEIEVVAIDRPGRLGYMRAMHRFLMHYALVYLALGGGLLITLSLPRDQWIEVILTVTAIAMVFLVPVELALASWLQPSKRAAWDRMSKTQVRYRKS
jgi:tRNA A-37 threonylcarbamoyl transferase component Bud32